MPNFPSPEWARSFQEAVGRSPEYAEAARAWEGDVLLRVVPSEPSAPMEAVHLDLVHGECRAATFVSDARDTPSEFVFDATREVWSRILCGELDPVKAVLAREVRVRGNLAKVMRFTRATGLLIGLASTIPSDP
ncbi:MAG TPA: SCP2 sterol-binding domain-containing protein [Thermoplasmata archaeon]|nr:SCP2 sterol-binding domain-containing protein [Thermoplasmata archaeon]